MSGWAALGLFYALAVAIVCGVMVYSGRVQTARPETRRMFADMFSWLDERNAYPNAVSIARFCRRQRLATVIIVFAARHRRIRVRCRRLRVVVAATGAVARA